MLLVLRQTDRGRRIRRSFTFTCKAYVLILVIYVCSTNIKRDLLFPEYAFLENKTKYIYIYIEILIANA